MHSSKRPITDMVWVSPEQLTEYGKRQNVVVNEFPGKQAQNPRKHKRRQFQFL